MTYNELLEKYPELKTWESRGMYRICEGWATARLNHCQAWYSEQNGVKDIVILKSYETVVALYDKRENVVYDFLRAVYGYTATSCQHISKFARKMRFSFNEPGTLKEYPQVIRIYE